MDKTKRIEWIDNLRAFACFLVVLGHLLQSLYAAGIDNFFFITDKIDIIIYLFHMPLFMCLSGYLYYIKQKKFTTKEYHKFEFRKIVNLGIPYFVFYTIFILLNVMFSGSVNHPREISDLLNIFNNPMAPFWFLYALLSIFIITPTLEKICKYDKKKVFLIFSILKILSLFWKTNIYFIDSIMSWAIYFYLGVFIDNIKSKNKIFNIASLIIYIIAGIVYSIYYSCISSLINEVVKLVFASLGIYICVNIFRNIKKSAILDTFKNYTFEIYLTHTIFAAGIRTLLFKIGINNYFLHFIIGILASIYIPVLMSIICRKNRYLNFFIYPMKTIEEIKLEKRNDYK